MKRGHAEVVLGTCTFDGLLKVKDDQAFKTALKQGLGRGKAFGLGPLTVTPA